MQPVTPPRTRRTTNSSQQKGLFTPSTPFDKKIDKLQQSPEFLNKQASSISTISPSLTPRHRTSKKLGDALLIASSSATSRSLFPPTPSTVGSGRTKTINSLLPSNHHTRSPVQAKRKLIFDDIEAEQEDCEEDLETIESEELLKTPSKKLINEDLIKKWNSEKFDSDDDDETVIKKGVLTNPFMTSKSNSLAEKEFTLKKNHNPNELILINKKGEKIIKQLESDYKPKRLFK